MIRCESYLSLDISEISPARVQTTNLHAVPTAQTLWSTVLAGEVSWIEYCFVSNKRSVGRMSKDGVSGQVDARVRGGCPEDGTCCA